MSRLESTPEHLWSECVERKPFTVCAGCAESVKRASQDGRSGRWFITMGHAGFNSRANNGAGYRSKADALRAMRYYLTPADRRQQMRDFARSARVED